MHRVLVYTWPYRGCYGRCSCEAKVGPVDCADDMQGAIHRHHPKAEWMKHSDSGRVSA